MKRVFKLAFAVVVLAAVMVSSASASTGPQQDPAPIEVPRLIDALQLLATGLLGGAVVKFLFDRFKFFQDLQPDQKWWVVFVVTVGLPPLARLLLQLIPETVWNTIEPYWQSIATGFVLWAGSQIVHNLATRKPTDGSTPAG